MHACIAWRMACGHCWNRRRQGYDSLVGGLRDSNILFTIPLISHRDNIEEEVLRTIILQEHGENHGCGIGKTAASLVERFSVLLLLVNPPLAMGVDR